MDLNTAIDAAHTEAERIEAEAQQLEARILATGARPPVRQYGRPVDAGEIAKNLTTRSLIAQRDPALAAYLGVADGSHQRRQEQEQQRAAQAARLQEQTAQLAAANAERRQRQERAAMGHINPLTGRRWGA